MPVKMLNPMVRKKISKNPRDLLLSWKVWQHGSLNHRFLTIRSKADFSQLMRYLRLITRKAWMI